MGDAIACDDASITEKGVTVHIGVGSEEDLSKKETSATPPDASNTSSDTRALRHAVVLHDVSFSLAPGSMTAVVGQVASGKTSLLEACHTHVHPTITCSRTKLIGPTLKGYRGPGPCLCWVCVGRKRLGVCVGFSAGVGTSHALL